MDHYTSWALGTNIHSLNAFGKLAESITWCFFIPVLKPPHVAVARPRVPMEVQVLQLRHGGHEARRQRRKLIVGQVEVLQGGKVEVAQQREGGEGCRVQLLKPVALQL